MVANGFGFFISTLLRMTVVADNVLGPEISVRQEDVKGYCSFKQTGQVDVGRRVVSEP